MLVLSRKKDEIIDIGSPTLKVVKGKATIFAVGPLTEGEVRFRPVSRPSIPTPRRMTSYNAVAPHDARRSTALTRSAGFVVRRVNVKMVSLNPMSVTSLPDGTSPRNSFTAALSFGIDAAMLPLMSIATISSRGTFSDTKCETFCG
jgi:hypothetical protein